LRSALFPRLTKCENPTPDFSDISRMAVHMAPL
jgi:hypothetical protein